MSLEEKINLDIKQAMLAREKEKLEALRAIKSAVLLAKTEKGPNTVLTEEQELKLLQKLVKQRKDAADIYRQQNRHDMEASETFQATIIEAYLPAALSQTEVEAEIKAIILETGANGLKEMGKVMAIATKKLAGKCDGKVIAEVVKKLLV